MISVKEMENQAHKSMSFFEFVNNLARQCGWEIINRNDEGWVSIIFSINNRDEIVDIMYLNAPDGTPLISFLSEEVPIIEDDVVEHVLSDYFLRRNRVTFPGHWGILKEEPKQYVYIIKFDINKITVEDFQLSVATVLEERQELYRFITAR